MPYEEMGAPAKRKDSKRTKPETIEVSEMQKKKRNSAIKAEK
jgi:hypothetical protein